MKKKGFTLIELMVVILIVGILAAVAVPLMQGRINSAKWSEANATAGTIRTAIRAYAAEKGIATAITDLQGKTLSDATAQGQLGFVSSDLTGTYFAPGDYTITSIDSGTGIAVITVSGSTAGLAGSRALKLNGDFN